MRTARAARRRPWPAEWPRRPGRTRCCARPRPPPRGRRGRSLDACSENDDGVEIELAAHEATGYLRLLAGRDHAVQPLARGARHGDEDDVGPNAVADGADDQRPPAAVAVADRAHRAEQEALAESRGADEGDAEHRVDDVDARRE